MGKDNGKDKGNDKRKGKDKGKDPDRSNKETQEPRLVEQAHHTMATTPMITVTGPMLRAGEGTVRAKDPDSSNKDDVEPTTKRRKIAALSVTMLMYVPDDTAHLVSKDKFEKWYKDAEKTLEDSIKKIDGDTTKFLKEVPIGIHAPVEPFFWRQMRMDRNKQ